MINDIHCKICEKRIEDINDLVNVNDEFYICCNCKENHWGRLLAILFKKD